VAEVRFVVASRIYPGTETPAVDALDLHIADGEFVVLVGPSGSGKTTALRMLAGLEEVDAGGVLIGEPLSNLDAKLRVQMRADIAALQSRLGITTVYVTHDQSEAMTLGHRVALLKDGRLQQFESPRELYDRPVNTFVAGFIGSPAMNLCELPCGANGSIPFGGETVPLPAAAASAGWDRIVLGLRPESLELAGQGIPAHVEVIEEIGADAYVFCVAEVAGEEVKLVAPCETRHAPTREARVHLRPRPDEAHVFRPDTGERVADG